MYTGQINIDERLAELWSAVYLEIKRIVDRFFQRDMEILLSGSRYVQAVVLTYDGVIQLRDTNGYMADAELFDDIILYEAYRLLCEAV